MAGKIILVTGGARSGKSLFAENYAKKVGTKVAYIATAQVFDEEMRYRIELHKKRRPNEWCTFESPFDAEEAMKKAAACADTILFDCLTIYTSNMLLQYSEQYDHPGRYEKIMKKTDLLLESAASSSSTVIFVTNEVGQGIVPENELAREYRDLAGLVNQKVANQANEIYLSVCGIAVDIRKLATEIGKKE
jgi:adenosylcobinamide kinase/adenosylcobinamide-phosphate guanylyltransferase